MRRKTFIGFIILSICFAAGGLYITRSIDRVILKLETIITLHQVEILRKTLLTDVKAVQQDLLLKDSPHATEVDTFVQHGEKMADEVESCFDCHHVDPTRKRLEALQTAITVYQAALSRVYTVRANLERLTREKEIAFHVGQNIIHDINEIVSFSSQKLADRTRTAMESIAATKRLLTLLVITGPAIGLAVAIYFIREFTGSMATLLNATRRLETGDLEPRIEGLRDEFGELGESFNEMALALKEMIHKIEESQKRYRVLFESAGDAIFLLEAEGENAGRIVSANQAAADMHGYTVDELSSLNIQDLDTPEAASGTPDRIRRILSGEWIDEEIFHRKKDGTVFPVEISAGLLEFEDQKFILAFDKDITERKQAEEALQRAEQMVIVGEMAAGLAHEIKNPLAGIKVSIEVLASELETKQEDKEIFERIIDEINRIETLLRNLLSYAIPPTPQFASLDVNSIIEAAIKTAEFSLKSPAEKSTSRKPKNIQFVKDLSDQLPQIVVDPAQLQQVMLNLLLNAVYAIQEIGTISVETSAVAKDSIRIVVSDTGKGIDEQGIEKIFLPFFTTKPKGTGLGLSICKRLIEQQNGTINAARNPEGGLMFTIDLRVEQESGVRFL
jgi:two-component system sensor histidine kinase AtoS